MRLLGYELTLQRKALPASLNSVSSQSSWFSWLGPIRESYTGAWQQNVTVDAQSDLLAFSAVFCAVTGIASDIGKLRLKLDQITDEGLWKEITKNQPWLPVLRKPNHYQIRSEFLEQWIVSKLLHGNAYILKQRQDLRGIVTAMYVLDPTRVKPLVADNGDVYYELQRDFLSGLEEPITVPASEIIHDKMVPLWHPLVGKSPLYACGVSATMGNKIQSNSTNVFANASRPAGILTVPGHITDDQAATLKTRFQDGYTGANIGKIAVLSDGMTFNPVVMTADAMQLTEQLKWTVEDVARAFHYPKWKMSGDFPPYSSGPEALVTMYYTDCLQHLIESIEDRLDEGLALPHDMGVELDLENLMRMDTAALYDSNGKAVGGGWMSPDEARFRANLEKVDGGSSPMIQQQNYSLAALAKRDAKEDPFAKDTATTAAPQQLNPAPEPDAKGMDPEHIELSAIADLRKELTLA